MTTTPSDQSLKLALARMLPDKIKAVRHSGLLDSFIRLSWKSTSPTWETEIRDSELLHVCWLVEQALTTEERVHLCLLLDPDELYYQFCSSSWQSRAIALAKVKGIEL